MIFPTLPQASSIKITSVSPTLISLTHSLKRQARRRGGQSWLIEASYPPLSREEYAPIWAFKIAQQGRFKTFTYTPYIYGSTSGTATGILTAIGSYNAGVNTISTLGLVGTLKAGDFLKFAGHDKVYMLTADGSTTLNIEPALHNDLADSEEIIYNDVPFTVAFTKDIIEMSVSTNVLISHSVNLVEIV